MGLGSAAPLFGALADRFVESRLGQSTGGRFISLLGDAELDEGNIWEALAEPLTRRLGNVLWIVDLNRQSLDRVIPGIRAAELETQFRTNGWDVLELKYGRTTSGRVRSRGRGSAARPDRRDAQRAVSGAVWRLRSRHSHHIAGRYEWRERARLAKRLDSFAGGVAPLVSDLGGHDLQAMCSTHCTAHVQPRIDRR